MCYFLLPPCHYLYSTAVQSSRAKFIATKNATFMQNLQCQRNNFSYKRLDFPQKIGMIITGFSHFDGKEYSVNQNYHLNLYITKNRLKRRLLGLFGRLRQKCEAFFGRLRICDLQILPTSAKN